MTDTHSLFTAPEDDKAHTAIIKLLAKSWKLVPSCFTLQSGDTTRRKRIDAPYNEKTTCLKTILLK